jgi:Carbon-nitrogen hydrolase
MSYLSHRGFNGWLADSGFKITFAAGAVKFLLLGALVGWFAWGEGVEFWRLASLLVLPLAWGFAGSRWAGSMLMAGYHLAGSRGLPAGTGVFFGDSEPVWFGWLIWAAACALLTLPFTLLWSDQGRARMWRFMAAAAVSLVPPLAVVGWLSTLSVAGAVYPGWGWAGLVLTIGLMGALVMRHGRWIGLFSVMAVLANGLVYFAEADAPAHWRGRDTSFPQLSSAGSDDAGMLLAAMQRVEWVKNFAKSVPANTVVVLPETVLGSFDGVSILSLNDTENALRVRGSRILVGAELMQSDSNLHYENVVVVLGSQANEKRFAVQNIPVPVAMWKPWASDGALANVLGRGNVIQVNGVGAGVLICYEQLLAYSLLRTLFEKPDVLVAVSNHWWARNTSIPVIQQQTVQAFSRLFSVGVVIARNG